MNRKTAIITSTFALLAFSGCSTIRQYDLIPEDNTPPTTVYVVDIGTPLVAATEDPCPTGEDCFPVGQPVPTTTIGTPGEPNCEDGQDSGTCNNSGHNPPVTVPDTTPAAVCGGNVTGECD